MKTDYKWELKLYPDATNYDCSMVLLQAQDYFKVWAFITHDRDKDENGDFIKPHIHFYGTIDGPRTLECIAHMVGLDRDGNAQSCVRYVKSWRGAIRYLIHADNPDKAKYNLEDVSSNFDLSPFFSQRSHDDSKDAQVVFDLIDEYRKKNGSNPSVESLARLCLKKGVWSSYRRGFAVWSQIIKY